MKRRFPALLIAFLLVVGLAPAAQALDVRSIDIAEITWPGAPKPKVNLSEIETAIKTDVNSDWLSFTTLRGQENSSAISFQAGKIFSTPLRLTSRFSCDRPDFTIFMNAVRAEIYKTSEQQDWQERHLVVLTPEAGCIWSGRAQVGEPGKKGGVIFLHDTAESFVITHELGHNLGLGHTNFMRCPNGRFDGKWGDCRAVEYGGTIDVMGNVPTKSPLSTYHQWRLGILPKDQLYQSWLNESVELSASDFSKGIRAVFIRDGGSSYWIEYRRENLEKGIKAGLVIYRTDPPPVSSIVSPNPADTDATEFGIGVGTDIWMLNLDSYIYAGSKSTGSMTLGAGKSFKFFSGNVELTVSAGKDSDQVKLDIKRTPDANPPPTPKLTPATQWRFQDSELITSEYDDLESAIDYFEIKQGDLISKLPQSSDEIWFPTFLNPINPPRMVYLRDLPEGDYEFALRAVDVWGNKSSWSESRKTTVDRAHPLLKSDFELQSLTTEAFALSMTGISDAGTGLCQTRVVNSIGWVKQRTTVKSAPTLNFNFNRNESDAIEAIDCLGNGTRGAISVRNTFVPVTQMKRTGKWEKAPASYGPQALKCVGRCNATISLQGTQSVILGSGAVDVYVSSKLNSSITASNSERIRISSSIELGTRKKVVRLTGKNYVLLGMGTLTLKVEDTKEFDAKAPVSDPSLSDAVQRSLGELGFNTNDFVPDWVALPMVRGTTLADPTLDLCGGNYKSESGREARRQISVTKVGNPYLFLSSEVVKYKSVSAAKSAIDELKSKFEACIKAGGFTEDGVFTKQEFKSLNLDTKGLVDQETRVLVHSKIGTGLETRTLLAFYQFYDSYFTGLYIVSPKAEWFSDSEILQWNETAKVLAKKMFNKVDRNA